MYYGEPMNSAVHPQAALVAQAAIAGRLTIYAGAGLSAAPPSSLPGAAGLARSIAEELRPVVDFSHVDENDLIAVADAVAGSPNGSRLLRQAVAKVARFDSAEFNYAHAAIALLLCEGVATVLETNYDDCVERAAFPERIPVVITDADRLDASVQSLLKVHGCITRPTSMLVTSDQLASPPVFADAELMARLTVGDVAFIGLGSPADYVVQSVERIVRELSADHLTIVDPGIERWSDSQWRQHLPELPAENRVAMGAEEFADALLRYYVRTLITRASSDVRGLPPDHSQRRGLEALIDSFNSRSSVWVARWLRSITSGARPGTSVVRSSRTRQSLLALAAAVSGNTASPIAGGLVKVNAGNIQYVLVVSAEDAPVGNRIASEALRRVQNAVSEGKIEPGAEVVAICCGHMGALGPDELPVGRGDDLEAIRLHIEANREDDSLIGDLGESHLIDGMLAGAVHLVHGDPLIDLAA